MKKIVLILSIVIFLGVASSASAHLPRIVNGESVIIQTPEVSQAFYAELQGKPAEYLINSDASFNLYINLLVPESSNPDGRYSANIFQIKDGKEELVVFVDGVAIKWQEYWEDFGRDFYFKGPEFEKQVEAGSYKIVISGNDNQGKYVLAIGKEEKFTPEEILKVYWVLPQLKIYFFKTPIIEFFKTPFVLIGAMVLVALLIIIILIFSLISKAIKKIIKKLRPKSILD
ncbi:hypothetical protein KJ786_01755 [Patescibacteria group bacterium]|nr:hypothetical protein [Patescibacteria group bacterium]